MTCHGSVCRIFSSLFDYRRMSNSLVDTILAILVEPRSARCAVNDRRNGSGNVILSLLHIDRSCCCSLIADDIVMSEYRDP